MSTGAPVMRMAAAPAAMQMASARPVTVASTAQYGTYAVPAQTTYAASAMPSYTPPPVAQVPSYTPPPAPAQSVLAGMPDPATVAKQKEGYEKMLDDQLTEG